MDWAEARPIVMAAVRWCRILAENGRGWPTEDDAEHSALLRRLLAGKDALPEPPPLANRYPWYALVDNGTDTTTDVRDPGDGALVISGTRWKIVERGPGWWRVQWRDDGPVYRVEASATAPATPGASTAAWRLTREVSGEVTA